MRVLLLIALIQFAVGTVCNCADCEINGCSGDCPNCAAAVDDSGVAVRSCCSGAGTLACCEGETGEDEEEHVNIIRDDETDGEDVNDLDENVIDFGEDVNDLEDDAVVGGVRGNVKITQGNVHPIGAYIALMAILFAVVAMGVKSLF